jgi:diguanylate cyclase (GGDEF)-like protein/PAS domain S-box-containing protein
MLSVTPALNLPMVLLTGNPRRRRYVRVSSMQGRRLAVAAAVLLLPATFSLFPWLLTNIFSSTYLPHGFCFLWNPRLLWLHVGSDSVITFSYVAIASTLAALVIGLRRQIHFQSIFVLFGTFILACGLTHLLDVVVLWRPLYWLQGDMKLLTACASLITSLALPFCLPQVKEVLAKAAISAENERRFLAAAECSLDSFYIFESIRDTAGEIVDFRFTYVNAIGARLLGRDPERVIGRSVCELIPENRTLGFFEKYKHVAKTGEPLSDEFAVDIDGVNASWLKIQAVKLDDGVAITTSDISDRKRLEAERASAFAESLIDKSPAAIIVTDTDHVIRALNPAARDMLRYSQEELIGREIPLIFYGPAEVGKVAGRPSKELGAEISRYRAVFAFNGEVEAGEWTFLRKGGTSIIVEAAVTPLKSATDRLTGFMITAYDISERKGREEAAAKAESQMDAINRSHMIIEFDMDGTILHANENYLRAFGYAAADLEGKSHSIVVTDEYRQCPEYQEFWNGLRRGEFQRGEFRRVGKGGREVWIEASYNPILDRNGAPVRVVKFAADVTERVLMQVAFRDAESQTRAILNNVLEGIVTIDANGKIVSVNPAAGRMFEYESSELIGHNIKILMPATDRTAHDGHLARYESTGKTRIIGIGRELDGLAKSGRTFPIELTITEVSLGGKRLFVGVVRDITERKRAEREAFRARAFRESLIENSPAAIIVTDVDFIIVAMNPAAQKLLWYNSDELIGHGTPLIFYDHSQLDARAKWLSATTGEVVSLEQAILSASLEPGDEHSSEWTFFRKGGTTVVVQVAATPLRDENGEPTGFMITAYDVSERKRREEYISHLAHHDVLTGLPTRQLFMDRLDMMLSRSQRFFSKSALLMIDLDNFKQVNDSFGHHVGDRLLIQVAERLRQTVRSVDTVARMGGDEFVVLISDLEAAVGAEQVARKLLAAFEPPFVIKDQNELDVTASIGICVYPDGGGDASTLLKNADIAMYHAKASTRHCYQVFDKKIAELVVQRREMEAGLGAALDGGELHLHYQPQFSLADGAMIGVEALLRWNSQRFGVVPPSIFIPVAESSGLILPIGAWVIRTACGELGRLQKQFGRGLVMAVNLSLRQLDQPDLLKVITQAIEDNGLDPANLEIEVTESLLMNDSPTASAFFEGLRELGVRVAIDDFGTGFSSMAYLLRFSVNRLKIDRCFIQDAPTNANSATVTSAIIALAHQLKVSVVAEGVESEEQMDFLRQAGCDDVQGFHLCRPVSADQIATAVAAHTTLADA